MRASKLVMCALSSTQALTKLDEALVRSVQCSKQARKALARGDVPVAWLDVTAADDAVAERLAPLLAGPARCAHDDDAFEAHNARTKREFVELFAGDGLDPANNELAPATAVAVARGLNLNAADAFCDLGCSAGALTMAVAVATEARLAHGVELSPRGTERALLAKERCGDDRVEFFQGDLRDGVDHAAYDVFYCGIRGVASRPRVLGDLLETLCAQDKPYRLVCAGFGVDIRGLYGDRVSLVRATVLRRAGAGASYADAIPLYGEGEGPRVLLEYSVT